jgi:hypothetical protein
LNHWPDATETQKLRRFHADPLNRRLISELHAAFERCFGKNKREPRRKRNRIPRRRG